MSKKAKAKVAKAKAAAASDERVYPLLFEAPVGSAGDPAPFHDASHQTVEPGGKRCIIGRVTCPGRPEDRAFRAQAWVKCAD